MLSEQHDQIRTDHTLQSVETYHTRAIWSGRVFAICTAAIVRYSLATTTTWFEFALTILKSIDSFTLVTFPVLVGLIVKYLLHSGLVLYVPVLDQEVVVVPQLSEEDLEAAGVDSWPAHKAEIRAWWKSVRSERGWRRFGADGWMAVLFLGGMVLMYSGMFWFEVKTLLKLRTGDI